MDFDWTEEQRAFRASVIGFAGRDLASDVERHDSTGEFDRAAWQKCADFGILGLAIPKDYGGTDAGALNTIVAMEALGYACADNGLLFSLNAQMWAVQHPIVHFGSDAQKARYLPGLADGSLIGSHAMSEPGSGSDAFALSTTVTPDGDGWRLNGSKTFATNAPVADVFVVFATADRARGFMALYAFLVDRDTPGLTVGAPLHKMGMRTSPMSEVFFDDCVVPAEALLGRRNAGMMVFNASMEIERSLILACTIGAMERDLERSVTYARERHQFGQPIGKFQAVANRLVDMKLRLETARLLLYRLGWLLDEGRPTGLEAALVKLHLSECFVANSLDALQVHGGYGYMTEYGLEREVRDSLATRIYSGTSDIQRNMVARMMGL